MKAKARREARVEKRITSAKNKAATPPAPSAPTTVADEAPPGVAFFASPIDLGMPLWSGEDIVAELAKLPRDGTVFALSRIAHILHYQGEMSNQAQRDICGLVGGAFQNQLARRALAEGRIIFTYDAVVRTIFLSLQHANPNAANRLTLPQIQFVLSLVPSVQFHVSGESTLDETVTPDERRQNARLIMLLLSNAPGVSNPHADFLFNVSLGALALDYAATPRNLSEKKSLLRLNSALQSTYGGTLQEIYSVWYRFCQIWMIPATGPASRMDYGDLVDTSKLSFLPANSLSLLMRVLKAACASPAVVPPEDPLSGIRSPTMCWPEGLAWRPVYTSGNDLACWDIRMLQSSLSFYFPKLIEKAIGNEWGILDCLWDRGVEDALLRFVRRAIPGFSPVVALPGIVQRHGLKLADWCFRDGPDLFVIEYKNAALPPGKFGAPTGKGADLWLQQRFFSDNDGFIQVYSTIAEMHAKKLRPFSKPMESYRRIWPLVVTSIDVPSTGIYSDEVVRLADNAPWMSQSSLPANVTRPMLLGREFFLFLTNGQVRSERHRPSRGAMLRQYANRGGTMESLASWLYRTFGLESSAHTMLDIAHDAVKRLDSLTHRIQTGELAE